MNSIHTILQQAQAQLSEAPLLDAIDARYESQLLLQHAPKQMQTFSGIGDLLEDDV